MDWVPTLVGVAFSSAFVVCFYLGRDYKQKEDRFNSEENRNKFEQIRVEIRGQKTSPAMTDLVEYISSQQETDADGVTYSVEDVLLNQDLKREIDLRLRELQSALEEDVKVQECWKKLSTNYGKVGNYFIIGSLLSILSVISLVLSLIYWDSYLHVLVGIWAVLGIVATLTFYKVFHDLHLLKKAKDFFEREDRCYLLNIPS